MILIADDDNLDNANDDVDLIKMRSSSADIISAIAARAPKHAAHRLHPQAHYKGMV